MEATTGLISKRAVDAVPPPSNGEARLWDTKLKGFFLRVYPTGRRVYAVRYRRGASQKIFTIGVHGSPWTPEQARQRAQEALDSVRRGEDPAATKKEMRHALTVGDLIDRYLSDGPATKPSKRAASWEADKSNLNSHVRPLVGKKIANSLTKADAARAISDITAGKTAKPAAPSGKKRGIRVIKGGEAAARRTRTVAAAMFAWGAEHGLITGGNPFSSIKMTAAPVKGRYLTSEEAWRLLDEITTMEQTGELSSTFADAGRLLLLTGARKTEILGLRWSEVDFDRGVITLPPERTKSGGQSGERRIMLSPPALAVLMERRQVPSASTPQSELAFPAARGKGHAVGFGRAFRKVCTRANLAGVRPHDLRHSFASFAAKNGESLLLIAKLLGHASTRTTERYAHLTNDPLHGAASAIGENLAPHGRATASPPLAV